MASLWGQFQGRCWLHDLESPVFPSLLPMPPTPQVPNTSRSLAKLFLGKGLRGRHATGQLIPCSPFSNEIVRPREVRDLAKLTQLITGGTSRIFIINWRHRAPSLQAIGHI